MGKEDASQARLEQGVYGFVLDRKRLKVFDPPIATPPGGFHLGLWKWKP